MKRLTILIALGALLCCMQTAWGNNITALPEQITLIIPGPSKVQLKMRLIPAGVFIMGSPINEPDRGENEGSQHKMEISKPFYLGIYEVTQAQWSAVMGTSPSRFSDNPNNPVEKVSWVDCQEFIERLNKMELGNFRLPTEVEWEYSCRAGTTTAFYWGEDTNHLKLGDYAWYPNNAQFKTQPVGRKKPNAWGLFDIQGNVAEWCADWYHFPFSPDKAVDFSGPSSGMQKVYRGGSWNNSPPAFRSANRMCAPPSTTSHIIGLRLVRDAQ